MALAKDAIQAPSYPIFLGESAPAHLNEFLRKNKFSTCFILVDENTAQHCLPRLIPQVPLLAEAEIIELESGEQHKNLETCTQVWRVLGELGADRHSLIVNLGGGVISDLGGFVASAFKRGIAFVNVPTTLLAQIDASVGGKTGVDLDHLKNEIGFFASPKALFIYPPFLQTLGRREMMSGFAEALKHGLIADAAYWQALSVLNLAQGGSWEPVIRRSVEIKNAIVEKDPDEKDLRKTLNFGHTIGHAVESYYLEQASATLLHGEAVVVGMICEAYLSHRMTKLGADKLDEITAVLFEKYGSVRLDAMADHRLLELMRHDKKNTKEGINFTLLEDIGKAVINRQCLPALIMDALAFYREKAALNVTNGQV